MLNNKTGKLATLRQCPFCCCFANVDCSFRYGCRKNFLQVYMLYLPLPLTPVLDLLHAHGVTPLSLLGLAGSICSLSGLTHKCSCRPSANTLPQGAGVCCTPSRPSPSGEGVIFLLSLCEREQNFKLSNSET